MPNRIVAALLLALLAVLPLSAADQSDDAIHDELRLLLQNIVRTVNDRQYDRIAQYFDPKMHVVVSDQEVLDSRESIEPYFVRLFGPGGFLKTLRMTLKADALTELNAARDFGTVYGSGDESYVLADGRTYDFVTQWTASVQKGEDGKWRVLTLHIGANYLDNPILDEAKGTAMYFALGGLIAGVIAGFALGRLLRRRRLV